MQLSGCKMNRMLDQIHFIHPARTQLRAGQARRFTLHLGKKNVVMVAHSDCFCSDVAVKWLSRWTAWNSLHCFHKTPTFRFICSTCFRTFYLPHSPMLVLNLSPLNSASRRLKSFFLPVRAEKDRKLKLWQKKSCWWFRTCSISSAAAADGATTYTHGDGKSVALFPSAAVRHVPAERPSSSSWLFFTSRRMWEDQRLAAAAVPA